MKAKQFIAAALLTAAFTATAQDADYRLGYCDNTQPLNYKSLVTDHTTIDAAIYLPASELERLLDLDFTGVSVGLQTKYNVAGLNAWIREDLNGENLVSKSITRESDPSVNTGWNFIKFDTPLKAEAEKGYYVGYTMTLSAPGIACINADTDSSHENACWIKEGDGEWTDGLATYGVLNLEALIHSDNLPQYDLELRSAEIENMYLINDNPVRINYSLYNTGMKPITSYTLVIEDEANGIKQSKTVNCEINHDARVNCTDEFTFSNLKTQHKYQFTLKVEMPNGVEDETPANNVITMPEITSILNMFARTVVIEEFTTESCGNCPSAAANLHSGLSQLTKEQQDRVAVVCHHSGYGTDSFTQPCDQTYLFFYGGPRIFAPGFMFDRTPQGQGFGAVSQPLSAAGIKTKVVDRMKEEAYYSVEVYGTHDPETRQINLSIEGQAASQLFNNPRITVYLVEDDVPANRQSGATTANYKHNHVIRAYNATWGAIPEWSDEYNYTATAKLNYAADCKTENMQIVAMVSNYDKDDFNNCEVGNAIKLDLSALKEKEDDNPSGVGNVTGESVKVIAADGSIRIMGEYESAEVYDLSGRRAGMANLPEGIYIVRVKTANGPVQAKVMVK